jgi:hypothetical protein
MDDDFHHQLPATTADAPAINDGPAPWLSIWIRPRATIRRILDTDPTRYVLILAGLTGVARALTRATRRNAGDVLSLPAILGFALILGPVGGIFLLYLIAALVASTGKLFGGVGKASEIRTAIAWGGVPALFGSLLWIPQIALIGDEIFKENTPRLTSSTGLVTFLIASAAIELIASLWSFVTIVKCVGEAHRFSAWRALGSLLLSGVVFVLAIAIPVVLTLVVVALLQ